MNTLTLDYTDTWLHWHATTLTLNYTDMWQHWHLTALTLDYNDMQQHWLFTTLTLDYTDAWLESHVTTLTLVRWDITLRPSTLTIGLKVTSISQVMPADIWPGGLNLNNKVPKVKCFPGRKYLKGDNSKTVHRRKHTPLCFLKILFIYLYLFLLIIPSTPLWHCDLRVL